ncbi:DMT family transporter [Oceanicaulis sp. MMSF_3324]|uniref:DMT family transporter n=1 Tax=Oceanicaulis sp. MMSF_3324 TaxID=3046702 RepID=UPI00273EEAD7|nr:DMT family transporter [Oceanicaulis sp. MMSF_3324]
MSPYSALMVLAGLGIPVLAALNAALGAKLGAPPLAALILFIVALCVTLPVVIMTPTPALSELSQAPRHLFLGGVFVVIYILSITYVAPKIGVGAAIFCVLLGQTMGAALIDHFGLFGAQPTPLSLNRVAGLGLMVAGLWLTQRAPASA